MSRSLHLDVILEVDDDAEDTDVADWLFSLLVDMPEDQDHEYVDAIIAVDPGRPR